MLKVLHSNRAERLFAELLRSTDARPAAGLASEVVLVPSKGVARWLTLQTATVLGVDCNTDYPYLGAWLWKLFAGLVADVPERSPFERLPMAWRLFAALSELPDDADHRSLRDYLARRGEGDRMELALQLAATFSEYLVYRPDWLDRWQRGERLGLRPTAVETWQARLWTQVLAAGPVAPDPREAALARIAALRARGQAVPGLPAVLRVFAVPLLPPTYVATLHRLAQHTDVELYVLNPCRQYWGDIRSQKEQARARLGDEGVALVEDAVGDALLASWGRQGRENLRLLVALEDEGGIVSDDRFAAPEGDATLARVQRSLLDLHPLDPRVEPAAGDRSLQIHVCHSLVRQIEVLHDQLLARFDADATLRPAEVLVLLPDLDAAASAIDAVFGAVHASRQIPYRISGRARPDDTPLLQGFLSLLSLAPSRFDAPGVAGLLATPAVMARYGLEPEELEQVRDWLRETGVSWALDAAHRQSFDVPADSRHTWAEGLARLVLGYAAPAQQAQIFGGLLPYDEIEGGAALTLGKLLRALSDLQRAALALRQPRSPAQWQALLQELLAQVFAPAPAEMFDRKRLTDAIDEIAESAGSAPFEAPVALEVIQPRLRDSLAGNAPGAVPTGAVTFAGLAALRGVPARVIAILGLDGGVFPRNPPPTEFNLMAARPRLGDRARRDDDRGAFLDAVIGARDALILSYTGRSVRDNARLPPSVLVAELLDALAGPEPGHDQALRREHARRLARWVTEHPLQPFSRRYFIADAGAGADDDTALFSYAGEYVAALRGPRRAAPAFVAAPLPPPDEALRGVELESLARFLEHPTKFWLQQRLGLQLAEGEEELPASEPFGLDSLAAWKLGTRLLEARLAGADAATVERIALAGSELPHGEPGRLLLAQVGQRVEAFATVIGRLQPERPQTHIVELPVGAFTLRATLPLTGTHHIVGWRYSRASFKVRVRAWLQHLVLSAVTREDVRAAVRTQWLCRDGLLTARAEAAPHEQLAQLLELYWQGLREPLAFMPRTAEDLLRFDAKKAQATWCTWEGEGECNDAWFALAHGRVERVPDTLPDLASRIMQPAMVGLSLDPGVFAAFAPEAA